MAFLIKTHCHNRSCLLRACSKHWYSSAQEDGDGDDDDDYDNDDGDDHLIRANGVRDAQQPGFSRTLAKPEVTQPILRMENNTVPYAPTSLQISRWTLAQTGWMAGWLAGWMDGWMDGFGWMDSRWVDR